MKFLSHAAAALLEGALVATVILVLVVGTTLAGKPTSSGGGGHKGGGGTTSGGTGTITLHNPLVVDRNGNGTPNWNDVVTFDISTSASQPWVKLVCKQSGTVVAQGIAGYFDGALGGRDFGLASPSWSGGAADCTAYLQSYSGSIYGSTAFHVDA